MLAASSSLPERWTGQAGPRAATCVRAYVLFGLAPDGVCRAGESPRSWCALTAPFHPYRGSLTGARTYAEAFRPGVESPAAAVCFLLHFPEPCGRSTLSTILPSGARTFLLLLAQSATVRPAIKTTLYPNSKADKQIDAERSFGFAVLGPETGYRRCNCVALGYRTCSLVAFALARNSEPKTQNFPTKTRLAATILGRIKQTGSPPPESSL